jgi:transposase
VDIDVVLWYNRGMVTQELILPNNVEELQAMVIKLNAEVENSLLKINLLHEQIRLLMQQKFGCKTEKYLIEDGCEQSSLFEIKDEEKVEVSEESGLSEESEEIEEITIAGYKRKKPGRKPLPEDIPREEIIHELTKEERQCNCGCEMDKIGEEISEHLRYTPASNVVERHVRYKYACKNCEGLENKEGEGAVKIAPLPEQLIPKSIATPSLLSHIFISKFADSIPFYRQEQQFWRLGVEISRATMCNWAMKISEHLEPIIKLLREDILSGGIINIDETTLQVLDEPGRSARSKSYMWVFRGGPPGKVIILYRYHQSRSGKVAEEFLGDYRGYVQTDGFSGYDYLDTRKGIAHVGCWSHGRRKFAEVVKASGKHTMEGKAEEALKFIRRLYRIEREVEERGLEAESIRQERQLRSKPILDEFEMWLKENAPKTPPKSLLGKAYTYMLSQWCRLIRYIEDGNLRMDNNWIENAIRPFAVGRKNWLFSGNPEGATASANIYSIIETAKANGLEPYHYLCYLFEKLLFVQSTEELKNLLPQNIKPGLLPSTKSKR